MLQILGGCLTVHVEVCGLLGDRTRDVAEESPDSSPWSRSFLNHAKERSGPVRDQGTVPDFTGPRDQFQGCDVGLSSQPLSPDAGRSVAAWWVVGGLQV